MHHQNIQIKEVCQQDNRGWKFFKQAKKKGETGQCLGLARATQATFVLRVTGGQLEKVLKIWNRFSPGFSPFPSTQIGVGVPPFLYMQKNLYTS